MIQQRYSLCGVDGGLGLGKWKRTGEVSELLLSSETISTWWLCDWQHNCCFKCVWLTTTTPTGCLFELLLLFPGSSSSMLSILSCGNKWAHMSYLPAAYFLHVFCPPIHLLSALTSGLLIAGWAEVHGDLSGAITQLKDCMSRTAVSVWPDQWDHAQTKST